MESEDRELKKGMLLSLWKNAKGINLATFQLAQAHVHSGIVSIPELGLTVDGWCSLEIEYIHATIQHVAYRLTPESYTAKDVRLPIKLQSCMDESYDLFSSIHDEGSDKPVYPTYETIMVKSWGLLSWESREAPPLQEEEIEAIGRLKGILRPYRLEAAVWGLENCRNGLFRYARLLPQPRDIITYEDAHTTASDCWYFNREYAKIQVSDELTDLRDEERTEADHEGAYLGIAEVILSGRLTLEDVASHFSLSDKEREEIVSRLNPNLEQ